MFKIKLFCFFLFTLVGNNSFSFEENLFLNAEFFVDSSSTYKIDDLVSNDQISFSEFTPEIQEQSFTDFTYWAKINLNALPNKDLYLISKNVFIDKIDLYFKNGDEWEVREAGLLRLNEEKYEFSSLSIEFPSKLEGEFIYVSFQSNCISKLDVWLIDRMTLIESNSYKTTFYAVILSLIVISLFVITFLYLLTRNTLLLHFAFYSLASIGMILFTNGYLYQYGPMGFMAFYKWSFVYFVDIYWGAAILLSFYLLKINIQRNTLRKIYLFAFTFVGIMMLSPLFLPRALVAQIHFIIPTLFIFFNVVTGVYIYFKQRNKTALLLVVGWIIYFGFLMTWSLGKLGVLPTSFFIDNCPVFGLTFEFLLFGFLAARQYTNQQKERAVMLSRLENIDKFKTDIEDEYGEIYDSLSNREQEVLRFISSGFLDKEIADSLGISIASVRTYSKRIYTKLKVSNRTEASLIYNKVILTQTI